MANCSNKTEMDQNIIIFELILYIPLFFLGVVFNTVALWVFYFKLSRWTETRFYMISLAMADYATLFTLPFIMIFHHLEWRDDAFCKVIETIYLINMPISIYTITFIAVDRYIAIKHPLKAKVIRSPQKAAISCLFLWLCCLAWMIMLNILLPSSKERYCFYHYPKDNVPFLLIVTAVFLIIPAVILTFCSTQIIKFLKEKQNASLREEKLAQRAICIVAVNMVTFIICFVPFNISALVAFVVDVVGDECWLHQALSKTMPVTMCLQNLNCCLDAICYYFVAKEFQEAILFKSMQSNSNTSQDSQLPTKNSKIISGCM
ncbi:G-protein coupled receptor 35-like [Sphaerodactylus townsendi]|uniref:G-protein coupled receptor 35-like n=1 Tax=Sphaerodactylus townsendi TaxID=933632 RepID=UPI0020269E2E|nr:G-protein coupled receptor 35-like [Sphaerodactylus townsendi]